MNELEYRLKHAHWLHQRLLETAPDCQWIWCEFIGLWETSVWTYGSSTITCKLMKGLNPGQRDE